MQPTYDELLELIAQLREENKRLQERVRQLEESLGLNSKNSSKPPSSDQKKNKRKPKGGAVLGHKGHHRKLSDTVDKRVTSPLTHCPDCGNLDLKKKSPWIFQQWDLPDIRPIVTQIECERGYCRKCRKNFTAPFPTGYDMSCFGPKLISTIGVCSSAYRMSKRTIQTMLKTLLGVDISLGSIPAMERKISRGLEPCFEELIAKVNTARVGYIDETTFRQTALTHYVWTVTTPDAALIRIFPSRGLDSLSQIRPRGYKGITVSDRYQVYDYPKHQFCLAHIQRDFVKYSQRDGPDGEIGKRAQFELSKIFLASRETERKKVCKKVGYRKAKLREVLYDAFANGSDEMSRFADRLLKKYEKLFLFTRYQGVETTNNAAERTLRHIVLWRKTSYGTQSSEGSRFLERAISTWMTLKKQKREVLPFFNQAYLASIDPRISTPSI